MIRRAAIFLILMISLLAGISNLPAVGAPTDTFLNTEVVDAIFDKLAGDGSRPGDKTANDVEGAVDLALAHSGLNECDIFQPYSREALVFRYGQLRKARVDGYMAGYHARRAAEKSWTEKFTRVAEIGIAMPGALEYGVREVLGFNALTRSVTGAEITPGWGGLDVVDTQGRLLAGAELTLMFFPAMRGGGFVDDFVRTGTREIAPGKGGTRVIIGENMDRVNAYARANGAQTIDDWLAASGRTWDEAANADWVRWVRQEGHDVIDIGPDFGRRFDFFRDPSIPGARPPSGVYGTERLELLDYGNYQSVFDRNGRFWGGVSGFDPPSVISPSQ